MRTSTRIGWERRAAFLFLVAAEGCRAPAPSPGEGALASPPETEAPGRPGAGPRGKRPGPDRWANSLGMEFRLVPAGKFSMEVADPDAGTPAGRLPSRRARRAGGVLTRQVELTRPFYIGILEVKDAEFRRVLGDAPSTPVTDWRLARDPDRPAVSVNYEEAEEFCGALSELPAEKAAGRRYRLPTEAEWVRSHGTGAGTPTWFEAVRIPLHLWVGEICADWYDPAYYRKMPETDPTGPPYGEERVCRMSWSHPDPFTAVYTFRVAADLEPREEDGSDEPAPEEEMSR
jgi:formylglycine-generating enzyme required for sulfatase activity